VLHGEFKKVKAGNPHQLRGEDFFNLTKYFSLRKSFYTLCNTAGNFYKLQRVSQWERGIHHEKIFVGLVPLWENKLSAFDKRSIIFSPAQICKLRYLHYL
jgi:hypothetical protein